MFSLYSTHLIVLFVPVESQEPRIQACHPTQIQCSTARQRAFLTVLSLFIAPISGHFCQSITIGAPSSHALTHRDVRHFLVAPSSLADCVNALLCCSVITCVSPLLVPVLKKGQRSCRRKPERHQVIKQEPDNLFFVCWLCSVGLSASIEVLFNAPPSLALLCSALL